MDIPWYKPGISIVVSWSVEIVSEEEDEEEDEEDEEDEEEDEEDEEDEEEEDGWARRSGSSALSLLTK